MTWIPLTLLAALFESFRTLYLKSLSQKLNPKVIAFSAATISGLLLLPFALKSGIPVSNQDFWFHVFIAGIINSLTAVMTITALRKSDVSAVAPLLGLSPVFILVTGMVFLGEVPTLVGFAGIITTLLGTTILNWESGAINSLKTLWTDVGQRYAIIVTLLWSVSSTSFKLGVHESSPESFLCAVRLFMALALLLTVLSKDKAKQFWQFKYHLLVLGTIAALIGFFQWSAVETGIVVYVLSLKRVSVVATLILGVLIFKEKGLKRKLIASLLVLIGAGLITVAG